MGGQLLEIGTEIGYLPWVITYGITEVILFLGVLFLKKWQPLEQLLQKAAIQKDRPKQAPRVQTGPTKNQSHPFSGWEQELFFRKKGQPQR